ncbi:MAG: RNA polymerase sigma factor [Propionibacteriaceae bacterium]|nr:RNA polymerase sigma factor [Propionibacteriaceae bacterium]
MEAAVEGLVRAEADCSGEQGVSQRARAAFRELFEEHYAQVRAFARRRTGSLPTAEDIAQEVFRLAWERTESRPPSAGWLYITARNLIASHHRGELRLAQLNQAIALELGRDGEMPQRRADLFHALEQLPEPQREMLLAHYWDGLKGQALADYCGCPKTAIWMRLSRARRELRTLMEEGQS